MNIEQARFNMVENQVRAWDVLDLRVLEVLSRVPRESFVPQHLKHLAFADMNLPLGHGEVMMTPDVEGRVLQGLELSGSERVLEIGTGSGFLTACLATLAREVVSVEMHADLADSARANLDRAHIINARIDTAEAVVGYDPTGTFDAVVVTGAMYSVPQRFLDWVAATGQLLAIVGESPVMQAIRHVREASGWQRTSLFETDLPYLANAAPPPRFSL